MRIPKPVNTVLDWAERQSGVLAVVIALVAAAVAAMWLPLLAGFILGIAFGGFTVQLRLGRRLARLRREVDDLLRENGSLRHRNTVLSSGIITREAQMTQALVSIPEEDERPVVDPQRTQMLPTLPDDEDEPSDDTLSEKVLSEEEAGRPDDEPAAAAEDDQDTASSKDADGGETGGAAQRRGGPAGDTADLGDVVGSRSDSRR